MLHRAQGLSRGSVGLSDRAVRRPLSDPVLFEGAARAFAQRAGRGASPCRDRVMASVVMADDGIAFDGMMAETAPLGGAETAFVALAEALAARGHRVEASSRCCTAVVHKAVRWTPLPYDLPRACDLYIGNRSHRVIGLVRRAKRRV